MEFNATSVLKGPLYQLEDYTSCLYERKQQYCLAEVVMTNGNNSSTFWQEVQNLSNVHAHFRHDSLNVGLCAPTDCNSRNISTHYQHIFNRAAEGLGIEVSVMVNQENCQTAHKCPITFLDYIIISVLLFIILLNVWGTGVDAVRKIHNRHIHSKTAYTRIGICFSLITNWKRLGSQNTADDAKALQCIQGIRTLSMILIVSGHSLLFALSAPIQNPEWLEESYHDFARTFFYNGHIIMGTYFCISGFLLSYFFFKETNARGKFNIIVFIKVIIHRYLRLTPLYAVMIALASSWFRHMGEGPMWYHFVSSETVNCQHHWWINLIYLNNYFYVDKPCLLHTWYIAADFQNYIITTLLLMLVWRYPNYDKFILNSVTIIWIIVPFVQTYVEKLDPTLLIIPQTVRHLSLDRTFQKSYITFHNNAGAYFTGSIFGYVYFNTRLTSVKPNKLMRALIWIIGLTLPWSLLLMGFIFYQPNYSYNVLVASLYAAFSKTFFAAGIATIIVGCALGYGWLCNAITSWRPFQILGRLSYSVYLIHYCVQRLGAGATKQAVLLTEYSLLRSMLADVVISYLLAIPACLLVEMPISALTKLLSKSEQLQNETNEGENNQITIMQLLNGNSTQIQN